MMAAIMAPLRPGEARSQRRRSRIRSTARPPNPLAPTVRGGVRRSRALSIGITVIETMSERAIAMEIAMAMSRKIWPAASSTRTIGMNTASVVRVDARIAPQTSTVPS